MEGSRRDFLKKSLKIGAVGGTMIATTAIANSGSKASLQADSNGVVLGKSSKKEVLYQKSKEWEYYYKIAY